MDVNHIATPFGRRALSLGMLANQIRATHRSNLKAVDKWKLFRTICTARQKLGLSDRSLVVLNALLTFYPQAELVDDTKLVVFPSNKQLSTRAHGMAEATIRRHLAALVEAGLIIRRDSPNGKRYVHRRADGNLQQAYGFSLKPLLARSAELTELADTATREATELRELAANITLCKRDISKLLELTCLHLSKNDHDAFAERFALHALPHRRQKLAELEARMVELMQLKSLIVKALKKQPKIQELSGNATQNERHIESHESESKIKTNSTFIEPESLNLPLPSIDPSSITETSPPPKPLPLDILLKACPSISPYGPDGRIKDWDGLEAACILILKTFRIPLSAYHCVCNSSSRSTVLQAVPMIFEEVQRTGNDQSLQAYFTAGKCIKTELPRARGTATQEGKQPNP